MKKIHYYSLADQVNDPWESGSEAISIGGKDNKAVREYYKNNNIPIVAYSSLARGLFSGKFKSSQSDKAATAMDRFAIKGYYSMDNLKKLERVEQLAEKRGATVPQIALAYLLNQQLRVYPVVSFSNVNHLDSNIDALNIKLTDDEIKYLEG